MTDKFEKWIEEKTEVAKRHRAREEVYLSEILAKYREFLEEQATCSLQKSNHVLGCELEAIATVLEYRKLTDEAETLKVVAARLK